MAPNGGITFFVLITTFTRLAEPLPVKPEDETIAKDITKKLMTKCQDKGFPLPQMKQIKSLFIDSNTAAGGRADHSDTLESTSLHFLNLPPGDQSEHGVDQLLLVDMAGMMMEKMGNCSHLSSMIQKIRNSSETSSCYLKAFVAPLSWSALVTQGANSIATDMYEELLWAAKPVWQDIPGTAMKLPALINGDNIKNVMNMMQSVYHSMAEIQKIQVLDWMKEKVTENNFNCTMRPPSMSLGMDRCKESLQWLQSDALSMMGPYLSQLTPEDVDSSPTEKLCEFFRSAQLRTSMDWKTRMRPSLGKKFLQKLHQCFVGNEFTEHLDKLGPLACYYDAPNLTPNLTMTLLSQLDNCSNTINPALRKRLVSSLISNCSDAQELQLLGHNAAFVTPGQLAALPTTNLSYVIQNLGASMKWTTGQMQALVKKQLGDVQCGAVAAKDLITLQSAAAGLPSCALKKLNVTGLLTNREALQNISKQMKKGQLKAMLQGLREKMPLPELLQKLPGSLLRSVSFTELDKANISSLEQVENKTWTLSQAAYLAEKMYKRKQLRFGKLQSVLQGVTCQMINSVADADVKTMAQAMTQSPQWLSKVQAGCAARKLFMTLEKERPNYFESITEVELDAIPTLLLLHLPPWKVDTLPNSVCNVFLDKIQSADLSSLPLHAPSRPAVTQRALLCLANGRNLSELTAADVWRLGPLLCEVESSHIGLMAADVISFTLQAMASCQHIPVRHRPRLIRLLNQTAGDPSNWEAKTMESFGPLLLLDENATSSLPNKSWMKDVLLFLWPRLQHTSGAVQKKLFDLTTSLPDSARRKRDTLNRAIGAEPTEQQIVELNENNVYWTAEKLDMMSVSTFMATVDILGAVTSYRAEQLHVLSKKAKEAFGPVEQMTGRDLIRLGCISQGFSDSDLKKLPFSLDTLEELAHCGWNDSQLVSVWTSATRHSNLTAKTLGAADLVALNRFICALNTSDISQLSVDAFKDAVESLNVSLCSVDVKQMLKNLTVSAFGRPSTWTEAHVSYLDSIIAELDAAEFASLKPAVFSFVSADCIFHIPPQNLGALSVAQLEALGPDSAARLTSHQRAALRQDQLAAVERASAGSPEQPQKSAESGAAGTSEVGVWTYVTSLLSLTLWMLL